jgi:hypothetical protein
MAKKVNSQNGKVACCIKKILEVQQNLSPTLTRNGIAFWAMETASSWGAAVMWNYTANGVSAYQIKTPSLAGGSDAWWHWH